MTKSTGASIPYQFRPSKYVDRQVFVSLLTRYSKWRGLENAGYVSMGAYTMADHAQMYQKLGIVRLLSFDGDEAIRARAHFNRPIELCRCETMMTHEVAKQIKTIRSDLDVEAGSPLIVWFDYTKPLTSSNLGEIGDLLSELSEGDVVRITVNLKPENYRPKKVPRSRLPDPQKNEAFRDYVGELVKVNSLDFGVKSIGDISSDQSILASVVIQLINAASRAALKGRPRDFELLSAVQYRDGAPMLSVTGALVNPTDRGELLSRIDHANWEFKMPSPTSPLSVEMGQLTLREYLVLDRMAGSNMDISSVEEALGFDSVSDLSLSEFYEKFRRFARHYPSFLEVAT